MLTIPARVSPGRFCDGLPRRDMLRVGAHAALGGAGSAW